MPTLLEEIDQAGSKQAGLARKILAHPALLAEVIAGLQAEKPRVKYGCAKILRLLSEQKPEMLYPHFGSFVQMLDHPNKIFQWEAAFVLSHLARVDEQRMWKGIFTKYFAPITGPVMITAANVIGGAARIAAARPDWADRIAREMLKVSRARYQTSECRKIAIGHAINTLGQIFDLLEDKEAVARFVQRQRQNTRNATRKKAEQFLKKHPVISRLI